MASKDLNRYIKEHLKRQPKTLSMSQIEELVEYDAWLDEQRGLTPLALDGAVCASPECGGEMEVSLTCKVCGETRPASKA